MYVYERIYKEQNTMNREFDKIPINGRQTSQADQKRIRKIISDSYFGFLIPDSTRVFCTCKLSEDAD